MKKPRKHMQGLTPWGWWPKFRFEPGRKSWGYRASHRGHWGGTPGCWRSIVHFAPWNKRRKPLMASQGD